jgi:hypothetical protein
MTAQAMTDSELGASGLIHHRFRLSRRPVNSCPICPRSPVLPQCSLASWSDAVRLPCIPLLLAAGRLSAFQV